MRRRLGLMAALVGLLALPASALATFPGANGEIAFSRGGDIWAINSDGAGLRPITTDPAPDSEPAWSPDGNRLAFVRERNGNSDIWTVAADGSAPLQVTTTDADEASPAWSPDGGRLVFARYRLELMGHEIFVASSTGAAERLIRVQAYGADWSPTSDRIAIQSGLGDNSSIAFVGPEGQDYGDLPTVRSDEFGGGIDVAPSWAPDGTRLVYSRGRYDDSGDLVHALAVNAFSTFEAVLDPRSVAFFDPTWSPDGTQIAYSWGSQIWVVDVRGGDPRQVTFSPLGAAQPAWRSLPPLQGLPGPVVTAQPPVPPVVVRDARCERFPKVIRKTTAKMIQLQKARRRAKTLAAKRAATKRLRTLAIQRTSYRAAYRAICR